MNDTLDITMFPAKEGDAFLVSYGSELKRRHLLIDAGRVWTYKHALKNHLVNNRIVELELLVVTHVDRDHIEGALTMLRDASLDLLVHNVWFNTWDHLTGNSIRVIEPDADIEAFGAKMGEELSPLIVERGWSWNSQFDGAAVALCDSPETNIIRLGELTMTLLSPDQAKLDALIPDWEVECRRAGITPGGSLDEYEVFPDDDIEAFGAIDIDALADEPFSGDPSTANGASIAFLLEYHGRKVLFSGDAHADLLIRQLQALGASPAAPVTLDAFKVPHHGSSHNLSRELLELMDCRHYLVSTNGNYFKHPDDVAMARLVKYGSANSTIHFNYKTGYNSHWQNAEWQRRYRYDVAFPDLDGFKRLSL